uniref:G_PROTEIN_RECEP_F1_2 domain-containing protein n=1 Tax=Globodera rostochiensis TaxID=31243 RepID=A0A914H4Q5_GLORO
MDFSEENSLQYALYLQYKDEKPCWHFIEIALILSSIAFFGMVFNSTLIYVTIKAKNLHGTANYLLALNAMFELMHQYVYFTFLYLSLTGQNFIDYKLAVKIGIFSIVGYNGVFPSMLCTGIDRLICVTLPIFHKKVNKLAYLSGMLVACAAFSVYSVIIIIIAAEAMPNLKITGFKFDLYQSDRTRKALNFLLIISTIFVYVVTGIMIRKRKTTNTTISDKINRKIFFSLCLIVSVNIGGYFLMYIYGLFIMPSLVKQNSLILAWFGVVLFAIPLNISSISIAPILFVTSSEYRMAFQSEWKRLRTLRGLRSSNGIFVNSGWSEFRVPISEILSKKALHSVSMTIQQWDNSAVAQFSNGFFRHYIVFLHDNSAVGQFGIGTIRQWHNSALG